MLYVLDEPSIGLHQRDNDRLLNTLQRLKGLGNTLIVVEHDEDTMRAADYVVDIGPGAGVHGGQIVAQGQLERYSQLRRIAYGCVSFLVEKRLIRLPNADRATDALFKFAMPI